MARNGLKASIIHTESSCTIEMKAAKILWSCSTEYKMKYTEILSDADSKTVSHLISFDFYGPEVKVEKND